MPFSRNSLGIACCTGKYGLGISVYAANTIFIYGYKQARVERGKPVIFRGTIVIKSIVRVATGPGNAGYA